MSLIVKITGMFGFLISGVFFVMALKDMASGSGDMVTNPAYFCLLGMSLFGTMILTGTSIISLKEIKENMQIIFSIRFWAFMLSDTANSLILGIKILIKKEFWTGLF